MPNQQSEKKQQDKQKEVAQVELPEKFKLPNGREINLVFLQERFNKKGH